MFRIARNHSKKYHLCQKPDRSASARIWIFVLTSPSSGLFWKLWLSPIRIRGGWGQRWMTVTKSMMIMIMMILSACFLSAKSRVFEHLLSLFKTISNSGNSFCYLQSPLNCAAWLIKQHHCNAWPENQPWTLKYKLKTDLTHVLSVISPSRWQKISKCTWFSMVERSPTAATCAATQPPVLPNWKDTCWFTEANPAWLWDFLRYEIEKGLRAVQFTVERSLLFTHSVTFPAHQLVTSRFTTRYIQEKCLLDARNATTPALQLTTSRDTC